MILVGWLIFAFDDVSLLVQYAMKMFVNGTFVDAQFMQYFTDYFVYIVVAIIFSMPVYPLVKEKFAQMGSSPIGKSFIQILIYFSYIALFIVVISMLVSDTYNPFLYFRF